MARVVCDTNHHQIVLEVVVSSLPVSQNIFSLFNRLNVGWQVGPVPAPTTQTSVIVYLEDILQLRRLMAEGVAVRNVQQCYHCLGIWTRQSDTIISWHSSFKTITINQDYIITARVSVSQSARPLFIYKVFGLVTV